MSEKYCEIFSSGHLSPSHTAPVHPCSLGYQLSDYSVTATVYRQQRQHYWLVLARTGASSAFSICGQGMEKFFNLMADALQ